jgi:perosamine synthetase
MSSLRKYTPVASDLRVCETMAARWSSMPLTDCLNEIGNYLGVRHIFPVASGRVALYAILKAALPSGSKVVLPGYTCYTVAAAVVRAGMTPILSDSSRDDLGYDIEGLKKTLETNDDIRAVVVCHLFGIALDIDEIKRLAGPEVIVVDDAAQAFGIKAINTFLGTGGKAGFYSFGRGKNLSMVGGGLIVTDDDDLAARIKSLFDSEFKLAGGGGAEWLKAASYNCLTRPMIFNLISRLPGLHLGKSVYNPNFDLRRLSNFKIHLLHRIFGTGEKLNADRLEISMKYLSLLDGKQGISIPRSQIDGHPGTLRLPLLIDDPAQRTEILNRSIKSGWGLSTMYPTPLNQIKELPQLARFHLENSEYIARSFITLPTHRHIQRAERTNGIVEKIAGLVR